MIPQINTQVIENVATEYARLNKDIFNFCVNQIDLYKDNNHQFLLAIDDLITQTFVTNETDDTPEFVREVNRGRAFAVVCLVLKMVSNQIEINELYKLYD